MDRFWHLTCTTYGTWLPGDERSSVTRIREGSGPRFERDQPQTEYIGAAPGLSRSAAESLKGAPIILSCEQAQAIAEQFQETATHRSWTIIACAIMRTHFHILVGVPGDPDPDHVLGSFKAWASRRLNRRWGKPASDTWWTQGGSTRRKKDWPAVRNAVEYIRNQENPLVVWVDEDTVEMARRILYS